MKKIICLILTLLMVLSLFVGCNDTADKPENTTTTTEKQPAETTVTATTADPVDVENGKAKEAYQDILKTYKELLLLKKNNTNYHELYIEQHQEEDEIEAKVFHAVLRREPEKMGYSMTDINGDGIAELILLDEDYHIYTIFAYASGQAKVVDIFFGDGNHTGAIGPDGTIYKHGYGKGESTYAYVMKITGEGTLAGLKFGCKDADVDDDIIEYLKIVNGERFVIDFDEFKKLNEDFYSVVGNATDLTKSTGIKFTRMEI